MTYENKNDISEKILNSNRAMEIINQVFQTKMVRIHTGLRYVLLNIHLNLSEQKDTQFNKYLVSFEVLSKFVSWKKM
jgi:hypothetical protein